MIQSSTSASQIPPPTSLTDLTKPNSIHPHPHPHSTPNSSQPHHSSRFTRFFSKFTTATISSKRKSSLPNLSHHHHQHSILPKFKPPSDDLQATIKAHSKPNHPQSNLLSTPSPNIEDPNSLDEIDGADPNASIRPLTPSSKALSTRSPTNNRPRSSHSALSPIHDPDHAFQSASESPISDRRPRRYGSLSSLRSHSTRYASSFDHRHSGPALEENDDCLSTFGNGSLASTKPTTVVSLETTAGANRIALAPPTHQPLAGLSESPPSHATTANTTTTPAPTASPSVMAQPSNRLHSRAIANHHHQLLQSGSSLSPPPLTTTLTIFSTEPETASSPAFAGNVPMHSLPHPSQNPHPAALSDNASMITLASSGFAPSIHANQNFPPDEDASVRALAPSRRESTESLSSRWSGAVLNGSLRTTPGFFLGSGGGSVGGLKSEEEGEKEINE
ncbi:hypothetical protein CROQUDRAFT_715345 [Cronartium quercuum f. sp. fusiforme G11]|uniref:Uncharacterized protein n=1 Tax=Cronartium quercuum f. sp. fusiforme G11 TaxID=708437 RepID=A0A9P6TDK0_9BASI|nr:hypothetical protein CROQUDRAFT_715345 [Cronartium quercuum f. sp. fusiforme G11]